MEHFITELIIVKENKTPKIFLSYSWKDMDEASILEEDFNKIGIPLIKDTVDIKFKDSITNYMKSIRNADFAVILLSDNYLKSQNCMFEALEILKEQNHVEKLLPILVKEPKIFTAKDRIKYVKYWKTQKEELKKELEEIDVTSSIDSYNDLKQLEIIYSSVDNFLKTLGDLKTSTLESLKNENYKSIIDYLGFEDIRFLLDLFLISKIEDLTVKELAIERHIQTFGESAYALFSKAATKGKIGKKTEAKLLFEKSLQLDPNNAAAWNNLGFLFDKQFNQINKAFDCYKKAIEIEPSLIVARINLATVYSRKEKNKKAKEEYEKILRIAPHEPKAHNNIANIYRSYNNKEKVIFHFTEAIKYNPKYAEAYLNLANYYDVQLNEYDKALELYKTTKEIANSKNIDLIVDKMVELLHERTKN
jgi:tetratricopeptide (TPR) repeat protein